MIHVAVLQHPYIDMILDGTKTIESRLLRTRSAPFGRVEPGQRIFFKQSGGAYRAMASVERVEQHESLTPTAIDRLRKAHNNRICAPNEFWQSRIEARYAVLISIEEVVEIDRGPRIPPLYGRAWVCLPASKVPRSLRLAA